MHKSTRWLVWQSWASRRLILSLSLNPTLESCSPPHPTSTTPNSQGFLRAQGWISSATWTISVGGWKASDSITGLHTCFMAFFLGTATWRPGSPSHQGWLLQDGLPLPQPGPLSGQSWAFLHKAEVSPGAQHQGLNSSLAWPLREAFYSQAWMQKTGKHKSFAEAKNASMAFLKNQFLFPCKCPRHIMVNKKNILNWDW